MEDFIPLSIWAGLLLYPPLQYVTLRKLRGEWRILAIIPLIPMAPILIVTLVGLIMQSNFWPIFLIFAAPPAILYLAALLLVNRVVARRASARVSRT
ncbi:MAG TPA: hypothetical protein VMR54_07875 [Thermoanaerobaculia bacterium]|nr:hypothetical protein [Thermoanaerobaculia bacterium]